jgi:hypothetical protein
MTKPPRPRSEGVISGSMWWGIFYIGAIMASGTLLVLEASLPGGLIEGVGTRRYAQTMAFTTLTLFQVFNVFNARSDAQGAFAGLFSNRWLWGAVLLSFLLQAMVIYLPFLQQAFSTVALSASDWLRELSKIFMRVRKSEKAEAFITHARPIRLDRAVDVRRDHILGNTDAQLRLVEFGSYACPHCHAAHEVVAELRDRFGDQMRYIFRQRPLADSEDVQHAAEFAEYACETTDQFWPIHDALMKRGPVFEPDDFSHIAREFNLPPRDEARAAASQAANRRVMEDVESARRSGVIITRRYEGPWDTNTLAEAMLGTLGHRLHAATVDFVRWAPSAGGSSLAYVGFSGRAGELFRRPHL